MTFFFPTAAAEIDWSRGFQPLDKELAQMVLDLGSRQAELEADDNPFTTVVLAHLAAQVTRGDDRPATSASSR